jgi:hypothetical protein
VGSEAQVQGRVSPAVAGETWVVGDAYRRKIGDLVLVRAHVAVWLDLPLRIWFPRLVRRTLRRAIHHEVFLNDNRETLRGALLSRDSLIVYAFRSRKRVKRRYPVELVRFNLVRLETPHEVESFLSAV